MTIIRMPRARVDALFAHAEAAIARGGRGRDITDIMRGFREVRRQAIEDRAAQLVVEENIARQIKLAEKIMHDDRETLSQMDD